MDYEDIDSYWIHNDYCIANEVIEKGTKRELQECESSDAMGVYENEPTEGEVFYTGYCRSCNQHFNKNEVHGSSLAGELGVSESGEVVERRKFERKPPAKPITKEEVKEVLGHGYRGKGIRGLKDKYLKFFGHAVKLGRDGQPKVMYYPETRDGRLTGYKSRTLPKHFGYDNKGQTGIKSDLAGQVKFKDMQFRDICITGGEADMVAFFQQFDEYQERRYGDSGQEYAPMPVVSPTTGESSAVNQLRAQYDFINRAERIFIGMDNDTAGRAAAEAIAEIFPREKVFIISWSYKDPNNAIDNKEGKDYSAQTIRDFYNAKPYTSNGIVSSKDADNLMEEELLRPKIPLPPFMRDLQKKMAGGIPIGYMVNFIAESGIGKSTLVNEAIRHMIFEAEYKVGILSLELTAAQYMIAMLSREVGTKINLFETPEEAVAFINQPDVLEARKHLRENEFGEERFTILDERDGELDEVKKQCEILYNKHGCKIIVIDPIQDLFEGVPMEQQNGFVKWMKTMLKKGVTFVDVCHVRKGGNSTDKEGKRVMRELSEDDVSGVGAIVKSSGANIFMSRNKYAEHPIEQNTTFVTVGKCRWSGNTGRVGSWYYDNKAHTMYDLHKYFKEHPDELGDYDLNHDPFTKVPSEGFSKKAGGKKKSEPEPDFMDDVPL
ncbi:putative AAA family ATPase [Vibrio phage 424E50-1]|nr:putative AAA family ATPase [Vibrio phage 424E50-1]